MYAMERQDAIGRMLTQAGRVAVVDLARAFDVTAETVRRDLAAMESAGMLRRVHGGAVAADRVSTAETALGERGSANAPQKDAIARRAMAAVAGVGSVYLDAGTTTANLAATLAARPDPAGTLEVVTHSIPIAHSLCTSAAFDITVIGGRVRAVTAAAVGAETVRRIEGLRPDVAFVGANGISAGFGVSTPDPDEASVKRAIVGAAQRVIVLADSSKQGAEYLVRVAALGEIDVLVTDRQPRGPLAHALAENDVEVWLA